MFCSKIFLFVFGFSIFLIDYHVQCQTKKAEEVDTSLASKYTYHVGVAILGSFICGGAIIDEKFILTATDCFVGHDIDFEDLLVQIFGGSNQISKHWKYSVVVNVEAIYMHNNYFKTNNKPYNSGDIAVLKLSKPLELSTNPYLSKLMLPKSGENFFGKSAITSGYNWPLEGGSISQKLLSAHTSVISNNQCGKLYNTSISDEIFCAQVDQSLYPEDVCSRNAGGPLVYNNTIIGLRNIAINGCKEYSNPGLYANVASYVDFINNAMKNISHPDIYYASLLLRKH